MKAQIREHHGQTRELRTKAAEKEEDWKRSQSEELQISSQVDRLDEKLAKMVRQENRLNRKKYILNNEDCCLLGIQSEAKIVIWQATYDIKKYDQNQLIVLVDQVEAKAREANLRRSKAYELAVSDIYHRSCGNRNRADRELHRVEHWIEVATVLDGEITEHSSRLMKLNKRIEMAEHQRRRAQTIIREVEHDLKGVQFHISTAERHREELQPSYEAKRINFLQLRNKKNGTG